ncbi:conserved unknown protein [Ectocarpus siliculosus]|uniref:Uncharacterized protein n=1 Tax=Ectocarpus siliculosus TaxID=2880 RepID=D8LQ64_ECTSI|nr:conserved unknown protein [Ectocarpus siliculosus]|eukprot:CBN77444.1 conserved unknown protein [Ectocarpus siliculosus]
MNMYPYFMFQTTPRLPDRCLEIATRPLRLVDHEQRLSFAVIIGSFRGHGGKELDQHYVSLSYLHEPKGGLLPAEEENDPEEEPTATEDVDIGGGWGGGEGESAQARSSEIAKRFSKWIRAQRLAVLREFGAEEEESDGGLEDPGALTKGESGAGAVQGEDQSPETGENSAEPTTGTDGDDGATAGREEREEPFDDTLPEEESEGQGQGDEEVGEAETTPETETAPDREQDIADQGNDEDEAESDGLESRDWLEGDGGGELMNAVRKRQAGRSPLLRASDREATAARDVGMVETGRTAVDAIDPGPAANEGPTDSAPEAEDSGVGADEPVVQRSSPSQELPSKLSGGGGSGGASLKHVTPHDEATERTHTFHAFPPADTVTILCRGEPVNGVPNLRDDPSFTWEADGIGSFAVDGDKGRLSFQLPELSVAASFRYRQPWSEERPNSAGPEGWLQRTGLLPLHYFVQSMGSEAGYSLKATGAPRAVVGRGSIHMEANYGESFPTGWVWAQGCSATKGLCGNVFRDGELTNPDGGSAQEASAGRRAAGGKADGLGGSKKDSATPRFVLTGGRFVIGPITTTSFVLAFRSERHNWNFRTTDLDRIVVTASRKDHRLTLVAKSWGDNRVLKADIRAPEGSFGSAIYVPTPEGFSNAPGCVESYAATARFRLYTKGDKLEGDGVTRPLVLREEVEFKLAALEFGGEYQDT